MMNEAKASKLMATFNLLDNEEMDMVVQFTESLTQKYKAGNVKNAAAITNEAYKEMKA
jgi:hypothetical protein